MTKKWQIYEATQDKQEKIEELKQKYNINQLLATILVNRGIIEQEKLKIFLNPTRKDFHNPFLMPDMEKAVDRIMKAIEKNEKIIIYGDYDADGITSITVLKSFFKDIGIDADYYIPNRLSEGYGLNKTAVEEIANNRYNLMITVDCGITAIEEVELAKIKNIDTIVTDHHEVADELPKAIAVIDAKRKDSIYPCRDLAGVGVVFKLIQALAIKLGLKEESYLKYLDIVCVGTISDIVPLKDENRVIAKLGLLLINQTKNIGLKSILLSAGYKNIDSMAISLGGAPRINACGRMAHAEKALELLLCKNINDANRLTNELNEFNKIRQETEKSIFEEAVLKIENENLNNKNTIVVAGENWHHGVIGIVASKITEMYFKPSILLCYEDNIAKGSGRSITGFDLHDALMKCADIIDKFGGHSMAIGITIKKENVQKFYDKIEKIASDMKVDEIIPIIQIDSKISLNDIDKEMVASLKQLEPFGEGNKTPIFAIKNLKIDSIRALSEGKHLKLTLRENNTMINAIGFNMGNLVQEYKIGDKIDVAGVLEINTFNGVDSIQINLKDIMKSI